MCRGDEANRQAGECCRESGNVLSIEWLNCILADPTEMVRGRRSSMAVTLTKIVSDYYQEDCEHRGTSGIYLRLKLQPFPSWQTGTERYVGNDDNYEKADEGAQEPSALDAVYSCFLTGYHLVIWWRWTVIYKVVRRPLIGRASSIIDSSALFIMSVFVIDVIDWRRAVVYQLVGGLLALRVVKVIGAVAWGRISPVASHITSVRCRRPRQQAAKG
jgi:hypothetical protein